MQVVSVEKVSNIERRLTIVVPANQVEEAYAKQIDRFAKSANLKGFRPGKAPLSFIKQRFGEEAFKEAISDVIQKNLYQAITEQNLRPVSTPRIEPKVTAADQPLEFIASFEVLPEIEKINFSLNDVEKLNVNVLPSDIDYVIEQLRKQYTQWKIVDRPAQEKDRVVIDYYAIFDEKPDLENKVQKFPLELGSKVMIPGFEEGLLGANAQDERTLHLSFPEQFNDKEKAGKPVDFVVQVKQVYEALTPTIDESFLQKLGIKGGKEEDLKNQIQQSLELERDRLVKEKLKEQVFSKLLEQNPLEVPSALVERESKNIHDEIYQHREHHHHDHSAEEMASFNDIAKKRVALGLLISEFAKQAHLKADKERVLARVEEIAAAYESPAEVTKWLLSDERRSGIEAQILEDQVLEKLLEGVTVTEKTISYTELKNVQ